LEGGRASRFELDVFCGQPTTLPVVIVYHYPELLTEEGPLVCYYLDRLTVLENT